MAGNTRATRAGNRLEAKSPDEVRVVRALENNVTSTQGNNAMKNHNTAVKVAPATVNFHGSPLTVITGQNGERLVAMKPICENIGLGWQSQYNRIQRDEVLSTCIVIMNIQMLGDDQSREVTCLPLEYLNGWLFGIDIKRCREEIRPILIQYKRECYSALAAYFQQGQATNPRKPKKPKALPNGLTTEQQEAIKGLVKARVDLLPQDKRAKAAVKCWSALKNTFGCTYKKIDPNQFTDAVSLVARLELEGEFLGKEPEPKPLEINFPVSRWVKENPDLAKTPSSYQANTFMVGLHPLCSVNYRSPTVQLLADLEHAGYDVEACRIEFSAIRQHLDTLRNTFSEINRCAMHTDRKSVV